MKDEWVEAEEKMAEEYEAPRKEFVRLSEDEVNELLGMGSIGSDGNYELICAVENRLAEKNK